MYTARRPALLATATLVAGLVLSAVASHAQPLPPKRPATLALASPRHAPEPVVDPLLPVLGCSTDSDCEAKNAALRAERRFCPAGDAAACNTLDALHKVACTLPNGLIDRDADSCLVWDKE